MIVLDTNVISELMRPQPEPRVLAWADGLDPDAVAITTMNEAEKCIGHLYPKVQVSAEMAKDRPDLDPYVGKKLTVIAWIWARTVKSPNPAFSLVEVPLASSWWMPWWSST